MDITHLLSFVCYGLGIIYYILKLIEEKGR